MTLTAGKRPTLTPIWLVHLQHKQMMIQHKRKASEQRTTIQPLARAQYTACSSVVERPEPVWPSNNSNADDGANTLAYVTSLIQYSSTLSPSSPPSLAIILTCLLRVFHSGSSLITLPSASFFAKFTLIITFKEQYKKSNLPLFLSYKLPGANSDTFPSVDNAVNCSFSTNEKT